MSGFQHVLQNLDFSKITDMLFSIIPALICLTVHEFSHGYAAYRMGDRTAKDMGRLSLNPIRHIDLMGLLMMIFFRFGWAKPVPIGMDQFKNPKRGMVISALAGPVSNLVLTIVCLLLYGLLVPLIYPTQSNIVHQCMEMLFYTAYLSLALGIFNMIPIPPLDGSKVLFGLLPDRAYYQLMRYERYGMLILLLVVSTGILSRPLGNFTYGMFEHIWNTLQAVLG